MINEFHEFNCLNKAFANDVDKDIIWQSRDLMGLVFVRKMHKSFNITFKTEHVIISLYGLTMDHLFTKATVVNNEKLPEILLTLTKIVTRLLISGFCCI